MKLSEYDGKLVRVMDADGNVFSGRAEYGNSDFLECEYGLDEDGIFIEDVIICNSQIKSIEDIVPHAHRQGKAIAGTAAGITGKPGDC